MNEQEEFEFRARMEAEQSAPAKPTVMAKKDLPKRYEPTMGEKVSQGALNVLSGATRGAGSIGATLLSPFDAAARALNGGKPVSIGDFEVLGQDRRSAMDQTLQNEFGAETDSLGYKGGKIAAEIAGTAGAGGAAANVVGRVAPALAATGTGAKALSALASGGFRTGAPAAATMTGRAADMGIRALGGAVNGGLSAGMIDPSSAKTGALVGAALPPGLKALGKVGRSIGGKFAIGDVNRALAKTAIEKYGIPLGVGDIAEGGTIKALRSMLNDAPFSGGIGAAQREATQEGFNRAVGGTFGATETKLTADVVDAAKQRMGAEFDRIWNGNALNVDGPMVQQMVAMQQQAAKLPKNEGASLAAEINDIFGKMVPDGAGNMQIAGDVANKFQSYLRRRAEGSAGLKNELGDLRQTIISAFNRGIRPEDAAALALNRGQYKAFKTVEPLLNGAEAGVAGRVAGDVPAALLPAAVARQYPRAAGVPLADISNIGSRFLVDRTKQTGGSMRAALQNTALGTAIVGGGLTNPGLAIAAIPVAAGTNALLGSPALARLLVKQGAGDGLRRLTGPHVQQLGYRVAPVLSDQ